MANQTNESNTIYDILSERYKPAQPLKQRSRISISEKGVVYTANVTPTRDTVCFQIDGYIITSGCKCDKLILSENPKSPNTWIGHFIELKGQDISHAIAQLEASIAHSAFSHATLQKKYARIVGHAFPSNAGNPDFERARILFKTKYHCELKRLKSNQPDSI